MSIKITGLGGFLNTLNKVKDVDKLMDDVATKLSEVGAKAVQEAHSGVMGVDSTGPIYSDAVVDIERSGNETSIVATGKYFLFFEFGAGIAKNSPRIWENALRVPVPYWIDPIGGFGKGYGRQQSWSYLNKDGKRTTTDGYAAVHGFANAINDIVSSVDDVVKGVVNGQ